MKYEQSKFWPPLINSAYVPVWVQVRDFVLTLCGWVVSIFFLKSLFQLIGEFFVDLAHMGHLMAHISWLNVWVVARPFVLCSILAALWISTFAFLRIGYLSRKLKLRFLEDSTNYSIGPFLRPHHLPLGIQERFIIIRNPEDTEVSSG